MSDIKVGEWDFSNPLPAADIEPELIQKFKEQLTLAGASYEILLLCGTQGSTGGYALICKQTKAVQHPEPHIVAVKLYLGIKHKPEIEEVF